jgi:hypothetical protein
MIPLHLHKPLPVGAFKSTHIILVGIDLPTLPDYQWHDRFD